MITVDPCKLNYILSSLLLSSPLSGESAEVLLMLLQAFMYSVFVLQLFLLPLSVLGIVLLDYLDLV